MPKKYVNKNLGMPNNGAFIDFYFWCICVLLRFQVLTLCEGNVMRWFGLMLSACLFSMFGGVAGVNAADSYSSSHEAMVKLFKSDEEKTAKDAVWTAKDVFKVGVLNDGTNRDGYADYICQSLYENGFKGQKVWVQVIDIAKLVKSGSWVKLGEAHCL